MIPVSYFKAGETEKAKQCLGRAITVNPNQGHAKYFSLAQLFSGQEALEIYQQGILVLEQALPQLDPNAEEGWLISLAKLSNAASLWG